MVIVTVGIWIFQSGSETEVVTSKAPEIIHVLIIATLFIFGIFIAYTRIKNEKQGLPSEDELSKKIRQKAAAWSYYFSLYVWVAALYLFHESNLEGNIIIGGGVLAMAILFGIFNLVFYKIGSINE
jgi:hypothetical protein